MNLLAAWMMDEMQARRMSQREFAEFVGVSHVTISRAVSSAEDPPEPSPDFLIRLARATHTDVLALFLLAYPEAAPLANDSAAARLAGDQFEKLPSHVQIVVAGIFSQWAMEK